MMHPLLVFVRVFVVVVALGDDRSTVGHDQEAGHRPIVSVPTTSATRMIAFMALTFMAGSVAADRGVCQDPYNSESPRAGKFTGALR